MKRRLDQRDFEISKFNFVVKSSNETLWNAFNRPIALSIAQTIFSAL